jgi:hypothetical protein
VRLTLQNIANVPVAGGVISRDHIAGNSPSFMQRPHVSLGHAPSNTAAPHSRRGCHPAYEKVYLMHSVQTRMVNIEQAHAPHAFWCPVLITLIITWSIAQCRRGVSCIPRRCLSEALDGQGGPKFEQFSYRAHALLKIVLDKVIPQPVEL